MAIRLKYDSLKEIPAEDVRLYVERDGAWHLDADLKDERAKLNEFRTNNVALLKQLEEHKKRFEGIDPDEVRKLAEEKRKLEETQQIKAGELDKVVETRLNALQFPPAAANAVILLAVTLLIIVGLNRIVDVRKEL